MNFFIKVNILLLISLLYACIPNSDDSKELSGDYFYRNEGGGMQDILSHLPGQQNIFARVITYDYNSDFIIAYQRPDFEEYKTMVGFELRGDLKKYPTNSEKERIKSEHIADSLLKNDLYYKSIFIHDFNYWIISHRNRKVFGPLTKQEYDIKRNELKMPSNLKLTIE